MAVTETPVDNGVNVEALLGVRTALADTPEIARFTWRGADHPERFAATEVPTSPPLRLDLRSGEIRGIVWATGLRPDHSWLDVPVFDRKGRVTHDGGVSTWPGLYLVGLPFLRRRKSSLIDGAAADARDLADHMSGHLDALARPVG